MAETLAWLGSDYTGLRADLSAVRAGLASYSPPLAQALENLEEALRARAELQDAVIFPRAVLRAHQLTSSVAANER